MKLGSQLGVQHGGLPLSVLQVINKMDRKIEPSSKMILCVLLCFGNYQAINQVVTIFKIGCSGQEEKASTVQGDNSGQISNGF